MPGEIAEQVNFGVPPADWRVLVFLIAGAVVSTVSFGLVPALQATRVELVRASSWRSHEGRASRPRATSLIAVQVGASALLLICAAVFLRSAFAAAQASPGLRTSDTIRVPIANEPRRAAIVREVTAHPSVVAVAAASPRPRWRRLPSSLKRRRTSGRPTPQKRGEAWPSTTSSSRRDISSCSRSISYRGRGFTDAEGALRMPASTVVSESAARRLWPNGDALGQVLRIQAIIRQTCGGQCVTASSRAYTVVGVARDVAAAQ